jgi:hypothetical protein
VATKKKNQLPLDLKVKVPAEKMLGAVQAYQKIYYPKGLKARVDAEWAEHVARNPGIGIHNKPVGIAYRNKVAERFYNDESDEVKAEVDRRRRARDIPKGKTVIEPDDSDDTVDATERRRRSKALGYQK